MATISTIYARCARNYALDSLSLGGLYISGGVSRKNPSLFNAAFIKEFMDHDIYKDILKLIPIYLIKNPFVGLLGASVALELEDAQ